ncbi:MAG: 4Fe-4S binding protein [Candidatus Methanoperedens sp.]
MKNEDKTDRYDLLENGSIRSVFKNRKTRFLFQLPAILLLVLAVFAGFFGIQNSNKSLATISIWVIWWSLLIISLALFGRIWCLMCPFGAAGYFFLIITWADFQFNLVNSPMYTAYFIVALLGLIVIISIIFERRSFCRYVCPITGLIGLYSMFAPFELRAKEKETCKICKEKYCISGNENGYACPVFEYPGTMEKNANCILCTECVKTCHRNNISFNLRSFAGDLFTLTKTRMDEALFILVLLGVTIFQTLVLIRPWTGFTQDLMVYTGASYDSIRFILFITAAILPILIYSIAIAISKLFIRTLLDLGGIYSGLPGICRPRFLIVIIFSSSSCC